MADLTLDERLRGVLADGPLVADELKRRLGVGVEDPALRRAMKRVGVKWDLDLLAYRLKARWE